MTINCLGKIVNINRQVMGILNITPDSFYDGGKYKSDASFLEQTEKMLNEGATFIDVGAASSKPSSAVVTEDDELLRIIPMVESLLKNFPEILLSIDTFRSKVARKCVNRGAAIINDISAGLLDEAMLATVANLKVPYIMMHMRGTPQTMKTFAQYRNIMSDLILYFSERLHVARSHGISDVIIDPGFGFAKTIEHNFKVLNNLEQFQMLEVPLLVGVSRKSMVYKTLNSSANDALNGTSVLHSIALQKGANILRVHDVKEAIETIKLIEALNDHYDH